MRSKLLYIGIAAIVLAIAAIEARVGKDARQVDEDPHFKVLGKAGIPNQINYQGYLMDNAGNAITDTLEMTFSIWDAPESGSQLWSETQPSVPVIDGLFNVLLGSVTPIPDSAFAGTACWLETKVVTETLEPRKQIVSVGYSFKAFEADTAEFAKGTVFADTSSYAFYAKYADSAGVMGPVSYADSAGVAGYAHDATHADSSDYAGYADSAGVTGSVAYADSAGVAGYAHDADMVDGQHASDFLSTANDWGRSGVAANLYEGTSTLTDKYVNEGQANSITSAMIVNGAITDADISATAAIDPSKISGTAWTSTNDGSGSGLDADMVDGQHASAFGDGHSLDAADGSPTDALYVDNTGNVGIGTTGPEGLLHIKRYGDKQLMLGHNNQPSWEWYFDVDATAKMTLNNEAAGSPITVMSFNTNGKVGIGTTSPTAKLHVIGKATITGGVHGKSNNANAGFFENTNSGNDWSTLYAKTNGPGWAVHGHSTHSYGRAGYFAGNVTVTGTLSKGGGAFKIDHPLDPENKYLYHSFVESPDMMNIYNGNVLLDENGEAWVELPEWFGALNRDFRYQLTAIGAPGPNLYIAQEISGNRFKIAGGKPGMKVSWQVTGIRQDAFANAHRIPVEEEKPTEERGYYLHPEVYGQPEERSVEWGRNPEMMRRIKEEAESSLRK